MCLMRPVAWSSSQTVVSSSTPCYAGEHNEKTALGRLQTTTHFRAAARSVHSAVWSLADNALISRPPASLRPRPSLSLPHPSSTLRRISWVVAVVTVTRHQYARRRLTTSRSTTKMTARDRAAKQSPCSPLPGRRRPSVRCHGNWPSSTASERANIFVVLLLLLVGGFTSIIFSACWRG